jgi:hypothetical protein
LTKGLQGGVQKKPETKTIATKPKAITEKPKAITTKPKAQVPSTKKPIKGSPKLGKSIIGKFGKKSGKTPFGTAKKKPSLV